MQMRTENWLKTRAVRPWFMLSFWFCMCEQTFFCVGETRLSHPTDPPFSRSAMKQLQFHCEVSRKDRSQAVEDKAERGLASPAFLLTCYAVLNLIKYTTQPNTLLVPCWRKKKRKSWGPEQLARRAGGRGCEESSLCLCWAARQWETRGTQSMFSFSWLS